MRFKFRQHTMFRILTCRQSSNFELMLQASLTVKHEQFAHLSLFRRSSTVGWHFVSRSCKHSLVRARNVLVIAMQRRGFPDLIH
jgi:hypothetical protein